MKTKIFKHKLLTAGAVVALGLGIATSAQAAPQAYAVSIQKITNFSTTFDPPTAAPLPGSGIGTLETSSNCTTDLPDPDDANGDINTIGIPPLPASLDADVSNCNATRAENDFTALGPGGDYGSGDAQIANTNIFFGGTASNIGEASTDTADGLNYLGAGQNILSARFILSEDAVISFNFDAEYQVFASLVDSEAGSAASASITFLLSITDIDGNVVFTYAPLELNEVAAIGNNPGEDGNLLTPPTPFSASSPLLVAGDYNIEIATIEEAAVTLHPNGRGDHYVCYKSFGHFLRQEVNLVDQFDNVNFKVLKPKMFCNPAMKPILDPERGIENTNAHLLSYKINEAHREPRHERKTVLMQDQFGSVEVQTMNPDRLMVPSGKSLDGTDPVDQSGVINHFKCYKVRTLGGFESKAVNIADQFTDPDLDLSHPLAVGVNPVGKDLVLVRPIRMCTPVSKNSEPIIEDPDNPRDHLMCYAVKAGSGARLNRRTEVRSNNQFGPEDLILKRELEFCAPASKTVLVN